MSDGQRSWTQISVDAAAARRPGPVWLRMTGQALPAAPRRCASELRLTAPVLDPDLPRLGDAAVAMDPLSGHGLFWALASALMAVPLTEAILSGRADLAARFYHERVVSTFNRQARVGRDFYRSAGLAGPFWRTRSDWPDDVAAEPVPPAASYRTPHVVVRDGRLAEAEVLVTPQDPEGAAFVGGIEIIPVLKRLGTRRLPDRAAFAAQVLPEAPPERAGLVFDWLAARGIVTAPALQVKEIPT
jgi:hypothetical protein